MLKTAFLCDELHDVRKIILSLEFKEKSLEKIEQLNNLIYSSFFENFYDQFILCAEINEKETTVLKKMNNYFEKSQKSLKKNFNFRANYAGYLKTDECKTYKDVKKKAKMHEFDLFDEFDSSYDSREIHQDLISNYNFYNKINAKESAFEILNLESRKYLECNCDEDINLSYELFHMEKEYNSKQEECYFGNIQWSIDGYTCEDNCEYIVNYLETFFKEVINLTDFAIGTIGFSTFTEPSILPFHSYFMENKQFEKFLNKVDLEIYPARYSSPFPYENLESLKSVEWLNYLPAEMFNKIDFDIKNEELVKCEDMENKGILIKINKDIKDVSIKDKLQLRKYINNALIKGYKKIDKEGLRWYWEEMPIYFDEIFSIKEYIDDEEYEILFISDGDLKYIPDELKKKLDDE